jgi:hypothetical protein
VKVDTSRPSPEARLSSKHPRALCFSFQSPLAARQLNAVGLALLVRLLAACSCRLYSGSRTPSASRSSSVSSVDIYNGVLDADQNGFIFCRSVSGNLLSSSGADVVSMDVRKVPKPDMARNAARARVDTALRYIRAEYVRRLGTVPGCQLRFQLRHAARLHDIHPPCRPHSLRGPGRSGYKSGDTVRSRDAPALGTCSSTEDCSVSNRQRRGNGVQ